ncbi:MAG: DUF4390 domain-containing protein [Deltaproteobacteria bacterium]|nr:MAG: DUF4390 domain-containing protein [Deltaproteobacteria bacterium]
MLKKGSYCALAIFLLFCISPTVSLAKSEARLSDIIVTNTRDHLLAYFNVRGCFTEEMNRAILNGISTKFTYIVKLYEVRNAWFDRKIADIKVTHTIEYNSLKNEFNLSLPEQDKKKVKTKDFDEARELMADLVALKVARLDKLKRGLHYQLRMKAELDKIELPFYLNYIFFFLSLWDFETDWYSVIFRY